MDDESPSAEMVKARWIHRELGAQHEEVKLSAFHRRRLALGEEQEENWNEDDR